MLYMLGTRSIGKAVLMPQAVLTESVVGKIYGIRIQTNGVSDPLALAKQLGKDLKEKFNAKLLYLEVDDSNILTIELEGSPFAWTALLLYLPVILSAFGIILGLIVVYTVTSGIPSWVYGLGVLSAIFIVFSPSIASKFTLEVKSKGAGKNGK